VNGYQGTDKDKTIIWSKNFPLTNKKAVKEETGNWSKKEKINFNLSSYDAFSVRAKEITGLDITNELIVSMTGKVTAHTKQQDLETPFNVNLQIPLMEDTLQIKKNNLEPIKNSITSKEETTQPMNKFRTLIYSNLLILCLISLVIMIFFTREPNSQELLLKNVHNILKNYGSRIVALQSIPKINFRQYYKVHSIKDLIKIADELQRPIFYEVDKETIVKDYKFHVIEDDIIYSLFLDSSEV
jgi:hypothetical protein